MALLSASSLNSRFTHLVVAAFFLIGVAWFFVSSFGVPRQVHDLASWKPAAVEPSPTPSVPKPVLSPPKSDHPIDRLVKAANDDFDAILAKETKTLNAAAEAYRQRRGRQPPPGFDKWFAFATSHDAVVVEEFFDQVYHDLNPFWGLPAKQIRQQANSFVHRVSVRDGIVANRSDITGRPWMNIWHDMVQSIIEGGGFVPDVDLAINVMDESRVVVPWEQIDAYMDKERVGKRVVPKEELKGEFQSLKLLDAHPAEPFDPQWEGMGPYWKLAVVGCSPDSPARTAYIETDFKTPPPLPSGFPDHGYEGFVKNWTLAKSPCDNPSLQGLHGTFVEPISIKNSQKLFPLFGGSKLPMNNEIILPAAMYWTEDPFYSGGKGHGAEWEKKQDKMIWRGAASGGRNKEENWTRFQRHRFVSMVNATSVRQAEEGQAMPNFVLPSPDSYDLAVRHPADSGSPNGSLADWISTWSDAGVVHLLCFPDPNPPHCSYTDPYFTVKHTLPMQEQYNYKYLPDIDGNSFSGRYRGFLGSTSLPIKSTIYQEWHDSRLLAWKHFVPMDNTFADIYGIMEYLLGNELVGLGGHDEVAKRIAMSGKEWAEKVLRKEDMMIYVMRLLLEYARVCDDQRDVMGWTGEGDEVT